MGQPAEDLSKGPGDPNDKPVDPSEGISHLDPPDEDDTDPLDESPFTEGRTLQDEMDEAADEDDEDPR